MNKISGNPYFTQSVTDKWERQTETTQCKFNKVYHVNKRIFRLKNSALGLQSTLMCALEVNDS